MFDRARAPPITVKIAFVLNAADLEQFAERGYVHLRAAFPRAIAARCREVAAAQLDIDVTDLASWREPVVRGLVHSSPMPRAGRTAGPSRVSSP